MDWKKVSIMTTEEGLEFLCYKLDEIGITQFEMVEDAASTQKILDETAQYWDYVDAESVLAARQPCVRVYLSDNDVGAEQMKKLTAMVDELRSIKDGLDLGSLEIVSENVRDEDWANNWKQFYKPMAVGKRLMVTPSWENPPEGTGRITLKMDPGMVFGTGAHETTQLCLAQLDEYVKPGMKVIDLGCGSGILSVAALLLGADKKIIRIMPNTPSAVGQGLMLVSANDRVTAEELAAFKTMMAESGLLDDLPENLIDAASAVSGCGPAYAYMFVEALADGAVKCGVPRAKAMRYAAQMLLGSASLLLETGEHPGALKDAVCSPGGSTIQGVRLLEERAFRGAVTDAVLAAYEKTKELGK